MDTNGAPLRPTGVYLIDQILSRARSLNLSMRELDGLTHAPYFANRKWQGRHGRLRDILARAFHCLGGHLRARAIAPVAGLPPVTARVWQATFAIQYGPRAKICCSDHFTPIFSYA